MMSKSTQEITQAVSGVSFKKEEYPSIMADKPLQKLMNKYYYDFTGEVNNEYYEIDSDEIIKKLVNGEINIGIVPDITNEQIKIAREAGVQLETFELTKDAVVFLNNSTNRVTKLKTEELIKIYSGEITNWSQVKGANSSIKAYHPAKNSYVYNMMLERVMGKNTLKKIEKENVITSDKALTNLDTDYYNQESRIGYTMYSRYKTMYDDVDDGVLKSDKTILINDVKPSEETILNKTYPYVVTYYIVIKANEPQNGSVRNWIKSVISEDGKNIAKEAGYIANR